MEKEHKKPIGLFWPLMIGLLIVAGVVVVLGEFGGESEAPAPDAPAPSTEWTTAPEGGVEVNLPETPIRNVEREDAATEDEATPEPE